MALSTQQNLKQQYRDATEYLDNEYAYFLTHVLNIGQPEWSVGIPTAAVAVLHGEDLKKANTDFHFLFNPEFAKQLTPETMGFILAHETLHVVLNHLKLSKRFKDPQRFNVAADCVINDYLVNMGLMPIEGLCRGENIVGYNCANATVSEVYADVKPMSCEKCGGTGQKQDGSGDPCDECGGTGQAQGDGDQGGYGQYGGGAKPIDDHNWIHDPDAGKKKEKAIDDANKGNQSVPKEVERTKQDDDFRSKMAGSGVGGRQAFMENKSVGLKWADLLQKVNPFMFKSGPKPRPVWHHRPRKLASFPEVNLPVKDPGVKDRGGDTPAIVMALDTSGSIGQQQANEFVNLARSVPQKKIKLFVCTFTTKYEELDLENPQWSSGGTAFDPISDYIDDVVRPQNKGKYPKAVVVVTDGYADFYNKFPTGEEDAWWWLLTENHGGYGKKPGHLEKLTDYVARKS
jgi:predicted metal-dependent peptidase